MTWRSLVYVAWRVSSACGLAGLECIWPCGSAGAAAQVTRGLPQLLRHAVQAPSVRDDMVLTLGVWGRHEHYAIQKAVKIHSNNTADPPVHHAAFVPCIGLCKSSTGCVQSIVGS